MNEGIAQNLYKDTLIKSMKEQQNFTSFPGENSQEKYFHNAVENNTPTFQCRLKKKNLTK